ncbi:MAG TPA: hypothetical protein PKJ75_08095, partial [Methanosarcina vacuolata]|nr:hypothetical protein [Methanosarcina vacuolata]
MELFYVYYILQQGLLFLIFPGSLKESFRQGWEGLKQVWGKLFQQRDLTGELSLATAEAQQIDSAAGIAAIGGFTIP